MFSDTLHLTNDSLDKMQFLNKAVKENRDIIELIVANFGNYIDRLSNKIFLHSVNNAEKVSKMNETINFIKG